MISYEEQINNIEQGIRTIEKTRRMREISNLYDRMIWNICRYDKNSKYNIWR